MWREDPSTTMVIGWNQVSGTGAVVFFDVTDHGIITTKYAQQAEASHQIQWRGMKNTFARLKGLKPNTTYYFVIKDSDGISKRMSFRTAAASRDSRFSMIVGGDSRNNREVRKNANTLVAKLRPNVVLFNGDMTENDTDTEWQAWLEDWQRTITDDGQVPALLVARGNHESNNETLINLFDVPSAELYYSLTFCGGLMKLITLNSLISVSGNQKVWLEKELQSGQGAEWLVAQYHFPMRPHTAMKEEKDEQVVHWASLFMKYGVQVGFESDSHVAKVTWPVRPSKQEGSAEGFIRDEVKGTVYIGEGCWGAPLRPNDDDKAWTRASGSFNHFNWIWVDAAKMEVRTVKIENVAAVAALTKANIFTVPQGLSLWQIDGDDHITLPRREPAAPAPVSSPSVAPFAVTSYGRTINGNDIVVKWRTSGELDGMNFELQRSLDGEPFATVITVKGKGSDNDENQYAILDREIAALHKTKFVAYRIKCIRPNGEIDFYDPQAEEAETESGNNLEKATADAKGFITVHYKLTAAGDVSFVLFNNRIKQIWTDTQPAQKPGDYQKSIDLSKYPPGKYFLIIKNGKTVMQRVAIRR